MKKYLNATVFLFLSLVAIATAVEPTPKALLDKAAPGLDLSLDGQWEVGEGRNYSRQAPVPGLAQAPAVVSKGALWYRRSVVLPAGARGGRRLPFFR